VHVTSSLFQGNKQLYHIAKSHLHGASEILHYFTVRIIHITLMFSYVFSYVCCLALLNPIVESPHLTVAKTPKLVTKSRARKANVLSQAEIEELEIEEMKKYDQFKFILMLDLVLKTLT